MKRFPRILIVTKSRITDIDSAGAALRNWFKEWPRDHLAQVYSGVSAAGAVFCERSFQLGAPERRLGHVFLGLKGSSLADAALPYREHAAGGSAARGKGIVPRLKRVGGKALVESGVWELIFTPTLSSRLRSFIAEFQPDAMFVQGCDISFMRLPMLIRVEFGTPIHFDIVDDWVEHLYRGSLAGALMNRVVQRTFRDLLDASSGRYTIGEAMAQAYQRRYGVPFTPLMQCDDQERFSKARTVAERERDAIEIVYSGSLALNRWKALVDLSRACSSRVHLGRPISITAYAPFVPREAAEPLRAASCLTVKPAVPDAQVPAVLAGADLLFLPESFDPKISEYTKLSVSTKAHLYMMSGKPSLVYGPAGIGTVEYARRHGWGHVVDREGAAPLGVALEELLTGPRRREEYVERARAVAAAYHSGSVVRESLRKTLLSSRA
jgi:glycosyltransferase involved in cell wall biosynthesis